GHHPLRAVHVPGDRGALLLPRNRDLAARPAHGAGAPLRGHMADIEIHRPHHLGLEGARAAADEMAAHLGRKFGLKGEWWGDVMRFERPGVTGSLTVGEKDLDLSISLGF